MAPWGLRPVRITILVENSGAIPATNGFRVKRSGSFSEGYRVRFYDALNNDVTGKVNRGTFKTPSLVPGAEYVMRATVKYRPQPLATRDDSVDLGLGARQRP